MRSAKNAIALVFIEYFGAEMTRLPLWTQLDTAEVLVGLLAE